MSLSFHYADPGATSTLCGQSLDGENYTNQADVAVTCGACYIAAVRGPDQPTDDGGRNIFSLTQIMRAGDYTAVLNCTVSRNARGLFWYCGSNRHDDLGGDDSEYSYGYGKRPEGGDVPCDHCPTGRQKFHASRRKFALAAGRRCLVCDARVGQPCVGIMGDSAGKPIATPHFRRMYPGAAWGSGGKSDV